MFRPFFFEKFLGAATVDLETNITVTLGGKSTVAQKYYTEGSCHIPLIETANALGVCARRYYEGRLTVIGSAGQLDEIEASEPMQKAAAYLVFGKYDPYSFTSEDYAAAKAKFRTRLVGSPEINDLSNEAIKNKIEAITKNARQKWETMNKGEDRVILWGDKPPVESEELHFSTADSKHLQGLGELTVVNCITTSNCAKTYLKV